MKRNFFADIPGFQDFAELARDSHYVEAPADWLVVIADIQGSTRAIQEGRYKAVNMAGAATVAAIVNAVGTREIPFVFGGDGSTALIPPESADRVRAALQVSLRLAQEEHGLTLRAGIVPHVDLLKADAPVRVAKYRLMPESGLAFFKGRGLTLAEDWVKNGRYLIAPLGKNAAAELDFDPHEGLSCRWAPLENTRGLFLSILVKIHADKVGSFDDFTRDLLRQMDQVLDLNSPEAHPVKESRLQGESIWKAVRLEASWRKGRNGWATIAGILAPIFFVRALEKRLLPKSLFDVKRYRRSLAPHSDFRKFDETLRMVIDCTPQMQQEVRALLEGFRQKGFLSYGLHASPTALMTCFVQKVQDGAHVHFIDGGDGGYAMAARGLKEQLKERAT